MSGLGLRLRALVLTRRARRYLARSTTTATLTRLVGTAPARPREGVAGIDHARALAAVRAATRATAAPCLPQAVALTALLARHGETPALILGCRRYPDGRWGAHAWVECAGDVLDPVPSGAHAALARCDARGGWVPAPVAGSEPLDGERG